MWEKGMSLFIFTFTTFTNMLHHSMLRVNPFCHHQLEFKILSKVLWTRYCSLPMRQLRNIVLYIIP